MFALMLRTVWIAVRPFFRRHPRYRYVYAALFLLAGPMSLLVRFFGDMPAR